jgi:hypothetical protein
MSVAAKGSRLAAWGEHLQHYGVVLLLLVVALAYRSESDELRRQCPNCGKVVKLHDAMCMRCGTDLDFPEFAIEPESAAARR